MRVALLLMAVAMSSSAAERSHAVRAEFVRLNPCPSTGARRGACPGWQVDHVVALCRGGPDAISNMAWRTVDDHALKTKFDVMTCRLGRSRPKGQTTSP